MKNDIIKGFIIFALSIYTIAILGECKFLSFLLLSTLLYYLFQLFFEETYSDEFFNKNKSFYSFNNTNRFINNCTYDNEKETYNKITDKLKTRKKNTIHVK